MTEAEWLVAADSWSMLHIVEQSRPSERKVRLFNAAICRRFWDYLPETSRAILMESELLADRLVKVDSEALCWRANAVAGPLDRQYPTKQYPSAKVRIQRDAAAAVCYAVLPDDLFGAAGYFWEINPGEKTQHAHIIRDIFGNPFRRVKLHTTWSPENSGMVQEWAQRIYNDRCFADLPVLAEALLEGGCENADILAHCRSGGEHVRGCWVIDLLLGKE